MLVRADQQPRIAGPFYPQSGARCEASVVPSFDRSAVLPLLADYAHKPLGRFYSRSDQKTAEWMLADASQPPTVLVQAGCDCIAGVAALAPLPWESNIFGLPMAAVRLIAARGDYAEAARAYRALVRQIIAAAAALGLRHLACRVPAADAALIHGAEHAGFRLMDTTLEYSWRPKVAHRRHPAGRWGIRPVVESDTDALMQLARESFVGRTGTRFGNDRRLPSHLVGRLYAEWARKSCEGTFADVVMVATFAGEPIGFLTCKIEREISRFFDRKLATIGIGAVRPDQEGQGIFAALGDAVLSWCADHGVSFVRSRIMVHHVASGWNALRTGARQTAAFHTFHKWIDGEPSRGEDHPC